MSEISIIIVTFNSESTIKSCLESILENSADCQIIVFDNASSDKTISVVEKFNNVILLKSGINLGFSKANNLAAKKTKGKYLIFLNPDTKIKIKGSLNKLVNTLKQNSEYGLIGPKLVYQNGEIQKSVRKLPTIWGAIKEYIFGIKGEYDFYLPNCQGLCEVDSITGACMVIKKEVFEKVGGWNQKYFLYFEDIQFCSDVRNLGLKIGYMSDIVIEHRMGASGINQNTTELSLQSSRIYFGSLKFTVIEFISRLGNKFRK